MSSNEEPTRLLEDPETSDVLRTALDAGRGEVPDAGQLSSLAAKLGPLLGGGGDGGGGGGGGGDGGPGGAVPSATASSGAAVVAKSLGALAITAALVTVGALSMREGTPGQTARRHEERRSAASGPEASRAVEAPATPAVEIALPRGVDVPESPEPPPVRSRRTPSRAATDEPPTPAVEAPSLEVDPAAELALIRQAQDALRTSPSRALALAETHERRFGDGALGQEREVVAIDALARLGRTDAARARAARFSARWPTSAHRRRVEVILAR